MRKVFFANMGGFRLVAPDYTFAVDAKQLLYLINKKYVELPDMSDDDIQDKNKADSIARLLTLLQAGWFLANTTSRVHQGIAVAAMELTTVSFIVITFASSYMWMKKPMDVHRSTPIICKTAAEQICLEAGITAPWLRSPLDFVHHENSEPNIFWHYVNEILHTWHLNIFERKMTSRVVVQRIVPDTLEKRVDLSTRAGS